MYNIHHKCRQISSCYYLVLRGFRRLCQPDVAAFCCVVFVVVVVVVVGLVVVVVVAVAVVVGVRLFVRSFP